VNLELSAYRDTWSDDDPNANFKAEVASYTLANPLSTLEQLSRTTGIPVGCLARYILVKWTASGSEALLQMGPIALKQMQAHVDAAEAADTDSERLSAYHALRQMIEWIAAGPGNG